MARQQTIKLLRTTRANLDTQKAASGLIVGEPYLITDEDRIAIATAVNAYETYAKESESGSGETCNVEALTADKTLTASDAPIQMYTCTASRVVNLPTTGLTVGQKFEFWNKNAYDSIYLIYLKQGSDYVDIIYAERCIIVRWDGTTWTPDEGKHNAAFGEMAVAYKYGSAIGTMAAAPNGGVASGYHSTGTGYGVAFGYYANTNSKIKCTIAIGAYSNAERNREIVSTATADEANKAQFTIQKFVEKNLATASAAWQELFIDGSSARLTIIASSVYNFRVQINAIDVTTLDVKTWEIIGTIKRNAANVTSMVGTPTVTVIAADTAAANWDARITADDTNESLKVEVKHDSTNNVRFSLNIIATETRV